MKQSPGARTGSALGTQGSAKTRHWLLLTLAVAVFYGLFVLRMAFEHRYAVEDDAKQHVFWMHRLVDPGAFPADPVADYFQSVAPYGYTAFYWIFARLGVDPLLLCRILPLFLGVIVAVYAFYLFLEVLPDPRGAFLAATLLGQMLWMRDDLMSAAPKGFVYPVSLACLYYLVRGSVVPTVVCILLQGLFYPQAVFVSVGLLGLRLFRLERGRITLTPSRKDWLFCLAGAIAGASVLLLFAGKNSGYGPVLTASQGRALPEMGDGGYSEFFVASPVEFWLQNLRSGFLPHTVKSPLMWLGVLLPLLLRRVRPPILAKLRPAASFLGHSVLVAAVLFGAAHLLLFKLHLPGRYSQWVLRVVFAVSSGLVLVVALQWLSTWTAERRIPRAAVTAVSVLALLGFLGSPWINTKRFPYPGFTYGTQERLYEFLKQQPKDTRIACVDEEAGSLPYFTGRSVLASRHWAIPYHTGYYFPFRERGRELVRAQYTAELRAVRAFIQQHDIDLWILHRSAFQPRYWRKLEWFAEIEPSVRAQLEAGTSALPARVKPALVLETEHFLVLRADRI